MPLLQQNIPRPDGADPLVLSLSAGDVVYLVGPNGSGKSALIARLSQEIPQGRFRRIAAHRQNWMPADASSYNPAQILEQREALKHLAQRPDARFMERFPADVPINLLLAALKAAENEWHREFARENRKTALPISQYEEQKPSPLAVLNDVLRLGALTVQVGLDPQDERMTGTHPGSAPIGVSKLSDGERNAIIIAGEVLTAPKDHIIIIDEPERHLHHSITEPLLNALFKKRPDCAFIISTHEISLPASTEDARTLILRRCIWENENPIAFDINLLPAQAPLPFDLRCAILGSRKRILFVEGNADSLDQRLYNLLFPSASVIPKGGCKTVIDAVAGIRGAGDLHWIEAFGLIDLDNRTTTNVADLQSRGVFALKMCSVESLFFGSVSRRVIATHQATYLNKDINAMLVAAETAALNALDEPGLARRLCARRCEAAVKEATLAQIPTAAEIENGANIGTPVDANAMLIAELAEFAKLRASNDLDGLIARYQLRESGCFAQISQKLLFQKHGHYADAVIARLEHDAVFMASMKKLIEPLSSTLDV